MRINHLLNLNAILSGLLNISRNEYLLTVASLESVVNNEKIYSFLQKTIEKEEIPHMSHMLLSRKCASANENRIEKKN